MTRVSDVVTLAMATCCTDLGMGCKQSARREGVIIDASSTSSRCTPVRVKSESLESRRAIHQCVSKESLCCWEQSNRTKVVQVIAKSTLSGCRDYARWLSIVFARRNATFDL